MIYRLVCVSVLGRLSSRILSGFTEQISDPMVFHSFREHGTTIGGSTGDHRIELFEIYPLVCISVLESTSDQVLLDFTMFWLMFLGFSCFLKDFGGYRKVFLHKRNVHWI